MHPSSRHLPTSTARTRRIVRGGRWLAMLLGLAALSGCGTTRMSDTNRTATEQLLVSSAIDRAVNSMNFQALSGKDVFFDHQYLKGTVDENYCISSIRQALLANGCYLREKRDDAEYVVEARAGAVGTNRHELLVGIPQTNLPTAGMLPGVPTAIPEIPVAKSTDQFGVAKLAVYAYNRQTGQPVWQSGAFPTTTTAKNSWVLGTGPFQKGTIYDGTRFAGSRIRTPWSREPQPQQTAAKRRVAVPVTAEVVFPEAPRVAEESAPAFSKDPRLLTANSAASVIGPPSVDAGVADYAPPGFPNTGTPLGAGWATEQEGVPVGHVIRTPAIDRPEHLDYEDISLLPTPSGRLLDRLFEVPDEPAPQAEEPSRFGALLRPWKWGQEAGDSRQ